MSKIKELIETVENLPNTHVKKDDTCQLTMGPKNKIVIVMDDDGNLVAELYHDNNYLCDSSIITNMFLISKRNK